MVREDEHREHVPQEVEAGTDPAMRVQLLSQIGCAAAESRNGSPHTVRDQAERRHGYKLFGSRLYRFTTLAIDKAAIR
jgi:hypothetical protein